MQNTKPGSSSLSSKGKQRRLLLKGAAATAAAGTITGAPMILSLIHI